ncbi:restriction endonuclease [Sorangium sp. So ce394]|uniref:restriction endonuclease n=1 Tax=Sorangium sp. So ce394 TaxID=3133310 RepID=UPI003F5C5545
MTNTGKKYEALTEQVFSRLLAQTGVCAQVKRDIILQGRATNHQIDVAFNFELGPVKYLTIVQCKDWSNPVKQEQVLAFNSVLQDIPGQPRGIMVSRSGFQEGARSVATHHGIQLYELREPREDDWDGLIRTIEGELQLRVPTFRNAKLVFDENWIRKEIAQRGIDKLNISTTVLPALHEATYESGRKCDLQTIMNKYIPEGTCDWTPVRHDFEEGVMVEARGCLLPQLRVVALTAEVQVRENREIVEFNLDHMVAYCFRDVLKGDVQFLDQSYSSTASSS